MANPITRPSVFKKAAETTLPITPMTAAGAARKTAVLLTLVTLAALFGATHAGTVALLFFPLLIAALLVGLVASFRPKSANVLGPTYAVLEGLLVGFASILYEAEFPGIVLNAVMLTFLVAALMLVGYWRGIIRVTARVRAVVFAATAAIAGLYLVDLLLLLFGSSVAFIHSSGPIGIGASVVVSLIAAYNLAVDFANIDEGVKLGAPSYMEWYGAFGVTVTLIWLYLEILRLLGKAKRR